MGRNRRSLIALLGVVAVVGSLLVVVPAVSAAPPPPIQLILGNGAPRFEQGSSQQVLSTASNGCQINQAANGGETLIDLNPQSERNLRNLPLPGLSSDSIGIKSSGSNSNGTPCSQIDASETLSVGLGSNFTGRAFDKVKLDLEMTGNAVTIVRAHRGSTVETFTLHTGTNYQAFCMVNPTAPGCASDADPGPAFALTTTSSTPDGACASPNSSGPNSGANDNCIWTIDPSLPFDRLEITVSPESGGTASLEGGADTGQPSEFYLANAAPTADDDSKTTDEDTAVSIDVLANDSDPEGDELSISAVNTGTNDDPTPSVDGTVSISNGQISYDPTLPKDADGFGPFDYLQQGESEHDWFDYTVSDGNGGSDTATVKVTVTGVNDPPVPLGTEFSGGEDTTIDIDLDISDPDNNSWTVSCTVGDSDGDGEPDGEVAVGSDGTGTFTPAPNFSGTALLTCNVSDGVVTDGVVTVVPVSVTVEVTESNDAPVANDDAYTTDNLPEDPTGTPNPDYRKVAGNVTDNDSDVEDGTPPSGSVTLRTDVASGTLVLNPDGSFTYEADADFYGTDSFTYTVADLDGEASNLATVTIGVPLECDENITFGGNGLPLYTVQAEYGGTCPPKVVSFDASGVIGQQFVELEPSTTTEEKYAFLERIEFLPEPVDPAGLQIPFTLYYDDVPPFPPSGALTGSTEAEFCKLDPRVTSGGVPVFDIDDDYDDELGSAQVLPGVETTCIIEASFVTTGTDTSGRPLVKPVYVLYNLGDGWRGAR